MTNNFIILPLLAFWLISGVLLFETRHNLRVIIYIGIFSLANTLCFLFFAAPDVALAEAAVGVFLTIFFIICYEKYYGCVLPNRENEKEAQKLARTKRDIFQHIGSGIFVLGLVALFVTFIPTESANTYLRDLYLERFGTDVGGYNAVTAIYLGYRVYDTIFEALILIVGIVAVSHMSVFDVSEVKDGEHSATERSGVAYHTIRIISPLLLIFGIYLTVNGIFTAGGGFQGGAVIAAFFVCRYMVNNIFDLHVNPIIFVEKVTFLAFTLLTTVFIFFSVYEHFAPYQVPLMQSIYLTLMNFALGMKVACGFFILFYRYAAIDRR